MKLIVRADDVGMSEAVNYGCLKAIEEGTVTTVGIMPNMPCATHAANLLKDKKNLSIGIHSHFMDKPLVSPSLIPSLVDETGNFVARRHRKRIVEKKLVKSEIILELEAEIDEFIRLFQRVPAYLEVAAFEPEFKEAIAEVGEKHNIPYDYFRGSHFEIDGNNFPGSEHYRKYNITVTKLFDGTTYEEMCDFYLTDKGNALAEEIALLAFHPGYIDQYVIMNSTLTLNRAFDVAFLCSEEWKQWIQDHKVTLQTLQDIIKEA